VQADNITTRVESACGVCTQRLKLKYDKLLSSFAFKINLSHYSKGELDFGAVNTFMMTLLQENSLNLYRSKVGRCSSPVSKPVLKAPMVSALEAII
jgi:hypothetical protein